MSIETEGIEQGFKATVANLFLVFYESTTADSKWSEGALDRFKKALVRARAARDTLLLAVQE